MKFLIADFRLPIWFQRGFVAGFLFALTLPLPAQEPEPSLEPTPEEEPLQGTTHLRIWTVLGDLQSPDAYTLVREPEKPKEGEEKHVVFTGLKGCYRSGYGAGYEDLAAGKYRYTLLRGDSPGSTVDQAELVLQKDASYTLLAVLDQGVPKLRLVQEYPTPPELDGIYVFNLLSDPPLQVQIGEAAPRTIPYSTTQPFVIPAAQVRNSSITFIYPTRRKTSVRKQADYSGSGRMSAVFMRNNYSRPSIFVYPSAPSQDETEEINED